MATTILNKTQVPLNTVFKDEQAIFTVLPRVPVVPLVDADVASKQYVDNQLAGAVTAAATGLDVKQSVRAATVATAGTYTATAGAKARGQITAAPSTLDGVTLVNGNRILVKNHSTPAANGIYVVTTAGTGATGVWDRATDFDEDSEVTANAFTFVEEGTLADTAWVVTSDNAIIVGGTSGTSIAWAQFAGNGTVTLATISGTLAPEKGGTGISNPAASTISLSGALAVTGSTGTTTFTISGPTNVTLPTTGLLVNSAVATLANLVSVGNITSGTWSAAFGSVSGANLTNLTAANLVGTIPAAVLANSTLFVGTTAVALNRASGNLALAGILSVGFVNGANTATVSPGVMAGNIALTLPLIAGSLIGTGDTGTVTNTMLAGAIAITKLVSSTISGISLGGNLAALTIGAGLSGTSYNGSTAITIAVISASANTASTIVARDASGNFSAGTITATLIGSATSVSNSVTFNNSGTASASGVTYNGSGAQTISWNTIGAQASITSANYITKEFKAITGTATYTLASAPVVGTEMIFVNGILQRDGAGNDYTITGSTVTFSFIPTAADVIIFSYFK